MYLETPKGEKDGEDWDVINLRVLRERLAATDWRLNHPWVVRIVAAVFAAARRKSLSTIDPPIVPR